MLKLFLNKNWIRTLSSICVINALLSCSDNNDNNNFELIGEWKLTEIQVDPGGGANFVAVQSEKTLEFKNDGTLIANGEPCSLSLESNIIINGSFSESDSTITTPNCQNLVFNQNENILIITIPCIEPCLAKYQKL